MPQRPAHEAIIPKEEAEVLRQYKGDFSSLFSSGILITAPLSVKIFPSRVKIFGKMLLFEFHQGKIDIEIAKELIDVAKDCGCDAVKFQKRSIDIVYSKEFLDSYRESPWGTTQREQKEGLEFGLKEFKEIDKYCRKKDIFWFASAWDMESIKFLQ